jgi:FkbM family methyltransferase
MKSKQLECIRSERGRQKQMSVVRGEFRAPSAAELERLYRALETSYFGDNPQERAEVDHFRQVVAGARVFVDVGASLGQYTYLANEVMRGGEILSLEADPVRFHRLAELCREWAEKSRNRLVPFLGAVCERDGSTPFFIANANVSGGLFLQREAEGLADDYAWQEIEVRCVTLDTLLGDKVPDVVKIDVEGAECRVLDGARRLAAQRKTRFFVEVHPWGDTSYHKRPKDVFGFFLSNGYKFRRLGRRWLFEPGRPGPLAYMYAIVFIPVADFVLRHTLIRKIAKLVVGCFDKVLGRANGGRKITVSPRP